MVLIDNSNSYFKKPHQLSQKLGKLTFNFEFKYPNGFPATCTAMERVARVEARDDESKRKGDNNYSIALAQLMGAFDTFIREYSERKKTAGWRGNYDLSIPCDLTILLIWNIRHTLTHTAGLIDDKCNEEHKKILEDSCGTKPVINLPMNLDVGSEFTIKFEDYYSIKKCVFQYMGQRLTSEDYKILANIASITDLKMEKCEISILFEEGTLYFDLVTAYDHGFSIDSKTKFVIPPKNTKYDFEKHRIMLSNGKSFSARYVKRIHLDEYFVYVVPNTRIDISKLCALCFKKIK